MNSITFLKETALSLDEAEEQPHFEKSSFRVRKKIFATLDESKKELVVKLSLEDQAMFNSHNEALIHPVKGGWGRQGWTTVHYEKLHPDLIKSILVTAYCQVAPKKLSRQYSNPDLE